ncbi:hypothetical protein N656DRAFT_638379 [Canariomyces notabilis]|uniref:Uncharacterized protein n=1 Tax=Canariomyces notabilis TaxID=2074819 RepID=A0AAN6TEM7_9PEZI|nr:hypothetical protein N656DRAFT_638379 [Canariomyces arenarius]
MFIEAPLSSFPPSIFQHQLLKQCLHNLARLRLIHYTVRADKQRCSDTPMDGFPFTLDGNACPSSPSNFLFRDFSVPVFEVPDTQGLAGGLQLPEITISSSDSSVYTLSSTSKGKRPMYGSSTTTLTSTADSSDSQPDPRETASASTSKVASQMQLERNHLRLKTRCEHLEKENAQMREDKSANSKDLIRAEAVLEGVLSSAELSQGVFESLSELADILLAMRRRLS